MILKLQGRKNGMQIKVIDKPNACSSFVQPRKGIGQQQQQLKDPYQMEHVSSLPS
jgi:hypothetical protein